MAGLTHPGDRSAIALPIPHDGSLSGPGHPVLQSLRSAIDGALAVAPVAVGSPGTTTVLDPSSDDPDDPIAVVVSTSGSTGDAKQVLLPRSALLSSIAATHSRLGGPGGWLLTLPGHHIAGLQVILRSLVADRELIAMDTRTRFTATDFVAAAERLTSGRRYVSLVPTQLHRLIEDPTAAAVLADFDAVLVGGAATSALLLDRASAAGVTALTTYGMSETSGGCVYDGRPLDGVTVAFEALDDPDGDGEPDGRILLSGPMIARGYLRMPDHAAFPTPGTFRTEDAGLVTGGRLAVTGRIDDMLISGGVNVPPSAVEQAIGTIPSIGEVLVVGVDDVEWGQQVVALVTGRIPDDALLRDALAGRPSSWRPKTFIDVDALPLRGPGKPDRSAAARLAADRLRMRR